MKKIGISFILLNIAVVLGSAAIISGIGFRGVEGSFFPICALVAVTYVPLCLYTNISNNKITDWIVAQTVEKNVPKHNFENPYTIYVNNATLMLDIEGGRIAYISNLNPWKFQLIYAKDIDDIKKGYKNLLKTTNYVYFQFSYHGKVTKFPTFVSRELRSIETDVVQKALKKANICVDVLNAAKYGPQSIQKGRGIMDIFKAKTTDILFDKVVSTGKAKLENQDGCISEFGHAEITEYIQKIIDDPQQFVILELTEAKYGVRYVQASMNYGGISVELGLELNDNTKLVEKVCSQEECLKIFLDFFDYGYVNEIDKYKPVQFLV